MRNSEFELPSQKLISALDLGDLPWAYLPLDDGFGATSETALKWDARGNPALDDLALTGTLGTAWSSLPTWLRANNSINARKNVADDAGIGTVFNWLGKTMLIGFQAMVPYGSGREIILHLGGGASQNEYGLSIVRESANGRIVAVMRGDGNTAVTAVSTRCGDMYTIASITSGATPTLTLTSTTKSKHSLSVGEKIYISNNNDTSLANGIYTITATPGALTVTIDATENGGANATGNGTSGSVGPKCNVALTVDDVNKSMQIWVNQVGETLWTAGTAVNYSSLTDLSFTTNTPRFSLFAGDGAGTDKFQLGAIRRLLAINYGAQGLADAIPGLSSNLLPALARSQMRPVWEMVP